MKISNEIYYKQFYKINMYSIIIIIKTIKYIENQIYKYFHNNDKEKFIKIYNRYYI